MEYMHVTHEFSPVYDGNCRALAAVLNAPVPATVELIGE